MDKKEQKGLPKMSKMEKIETPKTRPKEFLKQLAIDIRANRVFTSNHLRKHEAHLIGSVFMSLLFGAFETEEVGLIYEYMNKAGPRAINGLPMFTSVRCITKDELVIVNDYIKKLNDVEGSVI